MRSLLAVIWKPPKIVLKRSLKVLEFHCAVSVRTLSLRKHVIKEMISVYHPCQDHTLPHSTPPFLFQSLTDCVCVRLDTERTTIIIIHHAAVRAEPDPMTAIQGGGQRPSTTSLPPNDAISGMTQTPPTGGPLSPVTVPATRRPLLLPHKATGGATTQILTTNVHPHPPQSGTRGGSAPHHSTAAWSACPAWTHCTGPGHQSVCTLKHVAFEHSCNRFILELTGHCLFESLYYCVVFM